MTKKTSATPDTAGSNQEPGKKLDKDSQSNVSSILNNQQNGEEEKKRLIGKDFDEGMANLLKKGRADLEQIKNDRAALSTKKAAIIAKWAAKGLKPDAIIEAANYSEKTEDEKLNYDISYAFAREVFGNPIQVDMFEESVKAELRESQQANK